MLEKGNRMGNTKLKDAENRFIIETATRMFLGSSIDKVTMADIAREVGVGEATLYRRYSTKQRIVLECATLLCGEVYSRFKKPADGKNGYEQLEQFYNTFLEIFEDNPQFYAFIYRFDVMIADLPESELGSYENEIDNFRYLFHDGYTARLRDGSVREVDELPFYYSTTHALLNLCKKLTCQGELISQDRTIDKADEVRTLIDIVLYRLQA